LAYQFGMSDAPDDIAADDASPATAAASASPPDDSAADTSGETPTAVAASAGIDDDVLDVPRDLASMVRLQWIVRSAVGAGFLGAIAAGLTFVVGAVTTSLSEGIRTPATVGGAVVALVLLLGIVRAVLLYRSWTYVVRPDSLYLSRGVFTRVRTVVPYVRVQHVDTRRSPLERLLGLSTLVVYTAGSRGADVRIPGLTPAGASTLQQRLERLAIESEEADAV
jgi:hypothetical protein